MNFYDTKGSSNNSSSPMIIHWSIFLMGIFVTMPIVVIRIAGIEQSVFQLLFMWVILLLAIYNAHTHSLVVKIHDKKLILWLALSLVSCFIGWVYFGMNLNTAEFANNAGSYIPKVIMYIAFLVLINSSNKSSWNEILLKGIVIGCVINLVWAIVDAAGYYIIGRSLNNMVFSSYAASHNIHFNSISIVRNGMIRASGFNYDPAHLGFISPFILSYGIKKRSITLSIISVLGIVASASTTALVCSVLIALLSIDIPKKVDGSKRFKLNAKRLIILILGMVVACILIRIFSDRISVFLNSATANFFGRVSDIYLTDTSGSLRWLYIKYFPKALLNIGMLMFLGTGFGTASYGYISDPAILTVIGSSNYFAYDMENTYLAYLLDTGIIGGVLFFRFVLKGRKKLKELNNGNEIATILYSLFTATLLSMLFYHYILYAVQMLGLIVGTLYINKSEQ